MANTTATIHDHLKSVDPQWERLERVDLASQAYVAMLQMIHSACRDRQVVETVIRAIPERPVDGDTSPAVTAYRARRTAYQVVMLTDRTWIFASLPVPEDNASPRNSQTRRTR